MTRQTTVGEHLRTLIGMVKEGYGPYKKGETVPWPLPYETSGPIEICAVHQHSSVIGDTLDLVGENDPVPRDIKGYMIHDNGHRRRDRVPYWPTFIHYS